MMPSPTLRLKVAKRHLTDKVPKRDMEIRGQGVSPATWGSLFPAGARVGHLLFVSARYCVQRAGDQVFGVMPVLDIPRREWTYIREGGPAVDGARMFLQDGHLFHHANVDWQNRSSGRLSRFDLVLRRWSFVNTVGIGPGVMHGFSGDYLEKQRCYVAFGGTENGVTTRNIHVLAVPEGKWIQPVVKGNAPVARSYHDSCVWNDTIYIYGGRKGSILNDGIHLLKARGGRVFTWSSPRTNALGLGPKTSFRFVPFYGVLFLCGGLEPGRNYTIDAFDPSAKEVLNVVIEGDRRETQGLRKVGIPMEEEGGILLLHTDLRSYAWITLM